MELQSKSWYDVDEKPTSVQAQEAAHLIGIKVLLLVACMQHEILGNPCFRTEVRDTLVAEGTIKSVRLERPG